MQQQLSFKTSNFKLNAIYLITAFAFYENYLIREKALVLRRHTKGSLIGKTANFAIKLILLMP